MTTRPPRILADKKIGIVTTSWDGPFQYPHVFYLGVRRIKHIFNCEVKIFDHACSPLDELTPENRASDINEAFSDKSVGMIIGSIGGSDSHRILPFLDKTAILNNPKPFMGFSDTTSLLVYLNTLGTIAFHGPSVMAGFAETGALPLDFVRQIKKFFLDDSLYEYSPFPEWTDKDSSWEKIPFGEEQQPYSTNNEGWLVLKSGPGMVKGVLCGGNLETLEKLKETTYFPDITFWKDKILFLETSEEKPTPQKILSALEDYGSRGILRDIVALMFGRFAYYSEPEKKTLHKMIVDYVSQREDCRSLPILGNMDFGHSRPQFVLPLGVLAEITTTPPRFKLLESPFSK